MLRKKSNQHKELGGQTVTSSWEDGILIYSAGDGFLGGVELNAVRQRAEWPSEVPVFQEEDIGNEKSPQEQDW